MFNDDDLLKYSQLANIIENGEFSLEGKAVVHAAILFQWYNTLGKKLKTSIDKQKAEKEMLAMQESIKPIKKKKKGKDDDK